MFAGTYGDDGVPAASSASAHATAGKHATANAMSVAAIQRENNTVRDFRISCIMQAL